jgi:hypothetical protein
MRSGTNICCREHIAVPLVKTGSTSEHWMSAVTAVSSLHCIVLLYVGQQKRQAVTERLLILQPALICCYLEVPTVAMLQRRHTSE